MLIVGGLNYYLSQSALTNLAEKWLATQLADAKSIAENNIVVLRKYGLENIEANVLKAQKNAGDAIRSISIGKNGYIWILDTNGKVVMHPNEKLIGNSIADSKLFSRMQGKSVGKSFHLLENEEMLAVFNTFQPWKWYIIASAPLGELYGEANKMRLYMLVGGFITLLVTSIALMVLARRITAPLNLIAKEALQIEKRCHGEVIKLDRRDEIGTLSNAFSSMTHQLNDRIFQEQLISDISREFIHLSENDITKAIQYSLHQIGEYTNADRCYVAYFSFAEGRIGQTHEWCRQGIPSEADNMAALSLDAVPWFMQQLSNAECILAAALDELPPEAQAEKSMWLERHLKSVVRVPMIYGGELRGFVGLDSLTTPLSWTLDTVSVLKRIGEIFCNTLERQWYQETLAAEKERLMVTLQSIGDGVITTDVDGRVVLINRVGEVLTGWTQKEAVGQPINTILTLQDESTREIILLHSKNGTSNIQPTSHYPLRSILIAKDGHERLISSSAAPIFERDQKHLGLVLVFRDITQKRRMEEELIKVEKLESVGVLAGGIAHDFNNILTAIIGNISLVKHLAGDNLIIFAKMEEIEKASFRARDLTQQLLTFSKGGEPVKKTLSISQLFYDSAIFSLGGSNIGLEYAPPGDIWPIEGDEGQISQVINNLVINAVQAMPDGGVIRAHIENFYLPQESPLPLTAGKYIKLSLEDTGPGISNADLNRIFDPFFTTKSQGNGLGLATVYSILEKHDGYITVDSKLGKGTLFTLYLPASKKQMDARATTTPKLSTGSGKVLVMDDEEAIREVLGSMLQTLGYEVAFAEHGKQMLDTYSAELHNGSPFSAVLMDLTIPGQMGGKEAIGHLLKLDPKAHAIVSSGYSTDPVMSDFGRFGFQAAVSKPYNLEELSNTLSEVLGGNEIKGG